MTNELHAKLRNTQEILTLCSAFANFNDFFIFFKRQIICAGFMSATCDKILSSPSFFNLHDDCTEFS